MRSDRRGRWRVVLCHVISLLTLPVCPMSSFPDERSLRMMITAGQGCLNNILVWVSVEADHAASVGTPRARPVVVEWHHEAGTIATAGC